MVADILRCGMALYNCFPFNPFPTASVRFGVAEFVHFCIVTVFDNAAFFHGDRRVFFDGITDQLAQILKTVQEKGRLLVMFHLFVYQFLRFTA